MAESFNSTIDLSTGPAVLRLLSVRYNGSIAFGWIAVDTLHTNVHLLSPYQTSLDEREARPRVKEAESSSRAISDSQQINWHERRKDFCRVIA